MSECPKWSSHFGSHYGKGKRAMRGRDKEAVAIELGCSVDLDSWGAGSWPREPRWDYATDGPLGCIAIEIHPATAGEAQKMVAKQNWGRARLADVGGKARQWWWVPSGSNTIPASGAARRLLASKGIRVASRPLDESQIRKKG